MREVSGQWPVVSRSFGSVMEHDKKGAPMAQAGYKGKRVEVEIQTDTYKITGMLLVPLAGEGGYRSRLSDFLNNPDKHFPAMRDVKFEAVPGRQQKRGDNGEVD
jgi:hypothetical protein